MDPDKVIEEWVGVCRRAQLRERGEILHAVNKICRCTCPAEPGIIRGTKTHPHHHYCPIGIYEMIKERP